MIQHIEYLDSIFLEKKLGEVWPVIVESHSDDSTVNFQYPSSYFYNLLQKNHIDLSTKNKHDRITFATYFIDRLMDGDINIYEYHFGFFCIYFDYLTSFTKEDLSEQYIGQKRVDFIQNLPNAKLLSNDYFIAYIWSCLIKQAQSESGECFFNPEFNGLRLLFTKDLFEDFTFKYFPKGDWLEPLSGEKGLICKSWRVDKDTMISETEPFMTEGEILPYSKGKDHTYCVGSVILHEGSYIEVKFGDVWVEGYIELSQSNELITIKSNNGQILIKPGHLVRVINY
ncbi:hypothetical protein [Brevibacillus halotolerans]|uniref:hypothetical protein n=1 Tax=Brevibacillus halotolerans TaxID=1507437 RepID=UPI0015EF281D|nr:hypothetical protein [Brevibacillus halotolerans]MBA4535204.1 hypothetical protein [Brevibacillus halotolerans]